MKKTLIALVVVTATSGVAMAADWTNGGSSGSFNLGGTVSLESPVSPWEVKIGDAKTGLDAKIPANTTDVEIPVDAVISVLGIRSVSGGFSGAPAGNGLLPQIQYGDGNSTLSDYSEGSGTGTLSLDVKSGNDVIGTLKSGLQVVAVASNGTKGASLFASSNSYPFYGGLPTLVKNTVPAAQAIQTIQSLFPEALGNWDFEGDITENTAWGFTNPENTIQAAYASGIPSGNKIAITLNNPLTSEVSWQANLPISIQYN